MAKIQLSNKTFEPMPEGTYVVEITEVEYKQALNLIKVTIANHAGKSTTKKYDLSKDGALNAFSILAQKALDCEPDSEINPDELKGKFIRVTIEHDEKESTKQPGKMVIFDKITETEHADGWDDDDGVVSVDDEDEEPASNTDQAVEDALK